jgi:hypothetical protein
MLYADLTDIGNAPTNTNVRGNDYVGFASYNMYYHHQDGDTTITPIFVGVSSVFPV